MKYFHPDKTHISKHLKGFLWSHPSVVMLQVFENGYIKYLHTSKILGQNNILKNTSTKNIITDCVSTKHHSVYDVRFILSYVLKKLFTNTHTHSLKIFLISKHFSIWK